MVGCEQEADGVRGDVRLAFRVAYLGTAGRGRQSQADGSGIQDEVGRSFEALCGKGVRVHGAGRTDAGVHAVGQVVHVDVPRKFPLVEDFWLRAVNARLGCGVRVWQMWVPPCDFHARFSALRKRYCYLLDTSRIEMPFRHGRVWRVGEGVDWEAAREVLRCFMGRHDFRSFCAGDVKPEESTVREVYRAELLEEGGMVRIELEANGFLQRMVRMLVGATVRVALGKEKREWIVRLLENPQKGASRYAAPACGLYLMDVIYPVGYAPKGELTFFPRP
ncbi:MAG: tRNA pseudouridine(38-40) synthase TruA [Chthoniobacterales bacterium]|nr:tRNA pseudouridine(38-40) synthase TruA [Chthoniobacterales bacterium]